jgi:hypothetical protein
MSDDYRQSAVHYHDQAQRIRQLADQAHSAETRQQFLALAGQYERLAGQALRSAALGHNDEDERAEHRSRLSPGG